MVMALGIHQMHKFRAGMAVGVPAPRASGGRHICVSTLPCRPLGVRYPSLVGISGDEGNCDSHIKYGTYVCASTIS